MYPPPQKHHYTTVLESSEEGLGPASRATHLVGRVPLPKEDGQGTLQTPANEDLQVPFASRTAWTREHTSDPHARAAFGSVKTPGAARAPPLPGRRPHPARASDAHAAPEVRRAPPGSAMAAAGARWNHVWVGTETGILKGGCQDRAGGDVGRSPACDPRAIDARVPQG